MHTIVADTAEQFSQLGADIVAQTLAGRPDATLLVATGNTPMGIYEELAQRHRAGSVDTSRARVFQLDEYVGVTDEDDRSLYGWTRRSFIDPLGIPHEQVTRLMANGSDPEQARQDYEAAVNAAGGIDLAILGLGPNGHLGFNEPPCAQDAPTRLVDLTEESFVSNAVYWGGRDRVPRQAMTAGMDIIMAARHILVVVMGAHKRDILERTIAGPVTPEVPASWLQGAARVTILADRAALPNPSPARASNVS
jgi:glucosamine-6-phosphate deaminase